MKNNFVLSFILIAFFGCNKDKFQTIPQIRIKSLNGNVFPLNTDLRVTLEITDKEGDVDDSLYVSRQRLNVRAPLNLPAARYKIPEYPNKSTAEFVLTVPYGLGLTVGYLPIRIPGSSPARFEPDTMRLKFLVKDKAGNKSDSVSSETIYIIR